MPVAIAVVFVLGATAVGFESRGEAGELLLAVLHAQTTRSKMMKRTIGTNKTKPTPKQTREIQWTTEEYSVSREPNRFHGASGEDSDIVVYGTNSLEAKKLMTMKGVMWL